MLIIFISDSQFKKKVFEDTVSEFLKEKGIKTEVGYRVFPADVDITEELVKSCLIGIEADTILVSREIGINIEKEIIPAYYESRTGYSSNFSRYYRDSYQFSYTTRIPTETIEVQKIYYDTRLFKCESEELIWQIQTKVHHNIYLYNEIFDKLASIFYRELTRENLL